MSLSAATVSRHLAQLDKAGLTNGWARTIPASSRCAANLSCAAAEAREGRVPAAHSGGRVA
ncbi:hypothetical protein [Deinococcus rubellus]|uniref:hypothetical protein n=1 Tax=Deinococcus rubellus TaxID=1889240 RepID=UPI0035E4488D